MSVAIFAVVMDRIKVAKRDSPIAVFVKIENKRMFLDAVFFSTVATKNEIKNNSRVLIGHFCKDDGLKHVRVTISNYLKRR